ncbi:MULTISPECIES: 1,4-alpha-glucan branching protein [unclassified Streptomyces]|uniref:maltokinase N-terminal cap-like domain-containing protein n=1 Tax=unclassified Streptomyces TaxID=2593676 RepID=UPI0016559A20|nr:1,4-alpha-glucan branching protein [Streptomyces sp. CB02980]MCB8902097.1 1,4-alpha-glucan branching protein [Streptomyces sp. CB02980]
MAVIHETTMQPTKLELLTEWLPTREWHTGGGARPARVGGFRLDDPAGEVGIEFMAVTDGEGDGATTYLVPLTYRGEPLDGAEHALVGTSEHGVLGKRWIYDGTHDPVLVGQLYALLTGRAQAQAQSLTDVPDLTVAVSPVTVEGTAGAAEAEPVRVADGPDHTDVLVRTPDAPAPLTLRVRRVLDAGTDLDPGVDGGVTAEWLLPDGTAVRGVFAVAVTGLGS